MQQDWTTSSVSPPPPELVKWKVVPSRYLLSNQMRPPCISTRLLVMFRPRPVPGASRAFWSSERKNFWKILRLILGADADAIVLDPDVHDMLGALGIPAVGGGFGADDQHAAFGRVLVGVADQVDQHLCDARAVAPDLGQLRQQGLDDLLLVVDLAFGGAHDLVHDIR